MTSTSVSWPLSYCDLNLDSTSGENGYILKEAAGLDPPDFISVVEGFDKFGTPVMTDVSETKELVLKVGLNPGLGQSYSTLRDDLYKFISRTVYVKLMNDSMVIAQIIGHIKHFDAVHFSNQPEIEMTIECQDGEFSAPSSIDIPLTTLNTLTPIINYEDGTAPTGLDLQFTYTAVGVGTGFTIFNHSRVWYIGADQVFNEFKLTYPFNTGDIITISTQPKKKRITLLRGATTYDLAGYINGGAVWPRLYPGVNSFEWSFASTWMHWDKASYIPKYWGV
jgi:hypothetical protein